MLFVKNMIFHCARQTILDQTTKRSNRIFNTLVLGGILLLGAGATLPSPSVAAPNTLGETTLAANASLPVSLSNAVLQDASQRSGIPMPELLVTGAEQTYWPDGCLGLAPTGVICTQSLVLGWRVTVEGRGQLWVYRTRSSGTFVKLDIKASQINTLYPDGSLRKGEYLTSTNGKYNLIMQEDGNLVLYQNNQPLWASNTAGRAVSQCIMQSDGNLVIYGSNAVWASNTVGNSGAYLILQDDGNAVIYRPNDQPIWATGTDNR